jgi:MtrB/PioB family decaheme-associated outer membrane protein
LTHNISDTYQTPYTGTMGGNVFTLPASFGVINTAYLPSVATNPSYKIGSQILSPAQLAAFQTVPVHSDRDTSKFSAGYTFNPQWSLKFDVSRIDQTGAKLYSPATDAGKYGTFNSGYEKTVMLMNPTDYTTNAFNLAVSYTGDKAYFTASYYASFFTDANNGLYFSNPFLQSGSGATAATPVNGTAYAAAFPLNVTSTAPSNNFNQLNLTGGYKVSPTTKLAGGLSYARNTQNMAYVYDPLLAMQAGGLPQASLNATVVTTHADVKLTNQTTRDLQLSAGLKYNKRDNQTASNTYNFNDLGGGAGTAVNTPKSNRKTQAEVAADYRLSANNRVRLGYEYEDVKRWCDNALANTGPLPGVAPANWVGTWTNANTSCAQVPQAKEGKVVAAYRVKAGEAINLDLGYSYAKRDSTVNPAFYNPMQSVNQGNENFGYRAFFQASREEQLIKAGINWQATEQFSLGLNGRYMDDKYTDSPLGVQTGKNWSGNLDATFAYSDNGTISGYLSSQSRKRDMRSGGTNTTVSGTGVATTVARYPNSVDPSVFTNQLKDEDNTIGLNVTQKGLLGGKLELGADVSYSLAKTGYTTQVPYTIVTTAIPTLTCSMTQNLTCGSTPDIKNDSLRLKLTGVYQLDKASKVALGLMYQRLTSTDYYYNGYQNGYTSSGFMPTNEQAPTYSLKVIGVSYIFNF